MALAMEQVPPASKYFDPEDDSNAIAVPLLMDEASLVESKSTPSSDGLLSSIVETKIYYESFLITVSVFAGYAALFALQHQLKSHLEIPDDSSSRSHLFGVAVSFLYIGNLVMRLGHNFVLMAFAPRKRVIFSMGCICTSMAILSATFLTFGDNKPGLWVVFVAYMCGGLGIGSYEANMLSATAFLGAKTKFYTVLGMPCGIVCITIGSFLLFQIGVPTVAIYLGVLALVCIGLFAYLFRLYGAASKSDLSGSSNLGHFIKDMKSWRDWLPSLYPYCLVMMVDMFCVSLFSPGVVLYIYDKSPVHWSGTSASIDRNYFLALYNALFFLGDSMGRKVFYHSRLFHPILFLMMSAIGIGCGLSYVSEIAPFAALFVALANGSLYAQTVKKIDHAVHKEYNLTALSFWLFIGDCGSVLGSNLISYISAWMLHT